MKAFEKYDCTKNLNVSTQLTDQIVDKAAEQFNERLNMAKNKLYVKKNFFCT